MKVAAVKAALRRFCSLRAPELADDEDIFEVGGVTSLFVIELLTFLEKEFSISLEDGDLERDNFRSVNALTALVTHKLESTR